MKKIGLKILLIIYCVFSISILSMAMLFPFAYGMKDFPNWTGWSIYPLFVIIISTAGDVKEYFNEKDLL